MRRPDQQWTLTVMTPKAIIFRNFYCRLPIAQRAGEFFINRTRNSKEHVLASIRHMAKDRCEYAMSTNDDVWNKLS